MILVRLLCFCTLFVVSYSMPTSQTGKFWHISDLHYDPLLVSEKRSCVDEVEVIGEYGSHLCDANLRLLRSAVEAMRSIEPDPDFILWTGDSALHYWTPKGIVGTEEEIVQILTVLSDLLNNTFPNVPVISSLGNHDYVPDNQLPAEPNEIYSNISTVWKSFGWLDGEIGEHDSFEKYGYYTVRLESGLIVTALNTNFYYLGNKVYEDLPEDPGNQLTMLENLLKDARQNSDKVLISAHVPYGVGDTGRYVHMYDKYNKQFVSLVREYHDVIMGSFFGHEHTDAFKLVFDADGETPVSVAFMAPSITPWAPTFLPSHNPAIRLVEYDTDKFEVKDYTQYYFELINANKGEEASWDELYKFTEAYQVPDISPASALKAAEAIRSGEKITEYLTAYYCKKDVSPCDHVCRAGLACAIFEVDQTAAAECADAAEATTTTSTTTTTSSGRVYTYIQTLLLFVFLSHFLF